MAGPGGISDKDWAMAQSYGSMYNVDPLLLVAIGFHETNWGTAGLGRKGLTLGVGAYDSGASYKWSGLANQLQEGAKILDAHGVHTIADVRSGKASWWATDPHWAQGIGTWYDKLSAGGNYSASGSGTQAGVTDTGFFSQTEGLFRFLTNLLEGKLWIRIGQLFLGAFVVLGSVYVMMRKPIKSATKTGMTIGKTVSEVAAVIPK